ncbi:MAG: ABC transporter substrate-binding protein [Chloroflexi bacterium]|nr:ABC transporter substrate-binding protein [Chloroflexota bacterium]
MATKWINAVMALVLFLPVLLGACAGPEAAPATATPKPAVTAPTTAPRPAATTPAKVTPKAAATKPATAAPKPAATPRATPAPKPAATKPAASKPAPAPKPETVVALLSNFGTEGFLPHNDNVVGNRAATVYETLWDLDPETRDLRPMLAATLPEYSPDWKTLVINLRQGVQFHDGWGEMTAEDVKFSMELGGREGSINVFARDFRGATVEILGPYKLAVHLPKPGPLWAQANLSMGRMVLPIVSRKYVETAGEAKASDMPIGTGPFKMVRHELGQILEFEAVPNHYRETPDFRTLVIKLISEPATVVAMLRTGEADVAAIPLSFVPEARAGGLDVRMNAGVAVVGVGLGGQYLPSRETFDPKVPWVLAKEPEKALKVRKALNLAVNRQEIVEKVLYGLGEPWPIQAPPARDASYDPSWKPYPYDPEQAKRLLAEAGYPNGFETTMVQFPSAHATLDISEAVAIYWEKIGIKVKRLRLDAPTHRTRQLGRKNAGVAYPVWTNYYDEGLVGFAPIMRSNATGTNPMYEYPELDAMLEKVLAQVDPVKRLSLAREVQKKLYENYYAVPVSLESMPVAVSKRIGEWKLTFSDAWLGNFHRIKLK